MKIFNPGAATTPAPSDGIPPVHSSLNVSAGRPRTMRPAGAYQES